MMRAGWFTRVGFSLLTLLSGTTLLGSSCSSDIRDSLVAAGLDFVEGTAGTILETFIPVEALLNPA